MGIFMGGNGAASGAYSGDDFPGNPMSNYDEIIDGLLEGIEQLYLLISVQQAFLRTHFGDEWESDVARAQVEFAPHIAELFAPLRDALAGAPDGSYPAGDWRRVVQGLIDTANPPKTDS